MSDQLAKPSFASASCQLITTSVQSSRLLLGEKAQGQKRNERKKWGDNFTVPEEQSTGSFVLLVWSLEVENAVDRLGWRGLVASGSLVFKPRFKIPL